MDYFKFIIIITFFNTFTIILTKKRQVVVPLGLIMGNNSKVKLCFFGGSLKRLIYMVSSPPKNTFEPIPLSCLL